MGRDDHRTLWVTPEEFGTERKLCHHGRSVVFLVPDRLEEPLTLRFHGLGRITKDSEKPRDLFLLLRSTVGSPIRLDAWLSKEEAREGTRLPIGVQRFWRRQRYSVLVPPGSRDGLTLRLRGAGRKPRWVWGAPIFGRKNGDVHVRLRTYDREIALRIPCVDSMSVEDLAIEGFVYLRIDELQRAVGILNWEVRPLDTHELVQAYNFGGWRGIYHMLVELLNLKRASLEIPTTKKMENPGNCRTEIITRKTNNVVTDRYLQHHIELSDRFVDNPFAAGAILAHELCHVVFHTCCQTMDEVLCSNAAMKHLDEEDREERQLSEERTVDLLVCLLGLGELQVRAARMTNVCLGYYKQSSFERMLHIVNRMKST